MKDRFKRIFSGLGALVLAIMVLVGCSAGDTKITYGYDENGNYCKFTTCSCCEISEKEIIVNGVTETNATIVSQNVEISYKGDSTEVDTALTYGADFNSVVNALNQRATGTNTKALQTSFDGTTATLGLPISGDIKLTEDVYVAQNEEEKAEKEFDYIEIKSNTTIKNIEEFVLVFDAPNTVEDYNKALEKEYNKLDPYKMINITWYDYYQDEPNYSDVERYRTVVEDNFFADYDYDNKQFYIIEGRIYLPMRYIAESFGETVEWDGQARKAYVVRGTEKIDMSGIIYDGTTYI